MQCCLAGGWAVCGDLGLAASVTQDVKKSKIQMQGIATGYIRRINDFFTKVR